MPYPSFSVGEVLSSNDMNSVGMWKISTFTVSTALATVELANVFSSTYRNYRLVIDNASAVNAGSLALYFGTTAPANGYYSSMYYDSALGNANGIARSNNQGFIYLMLVDSNKASGSYDICNPQKAQHTTVHGTGTGRSVFYCATGGTHSATTQHTTLRIINDQGGNITAGTFTLYGYRD